MSAVPLPTRYPPPPASLLAYERAAVWRATVDNAAAHAEPASKRTKGMSVGKYGA